MNSVKFKITLMIGILYCHISMGNDKPSRIFSITAFNQNTALPSQALFNDFNPGLKVGIEGFYKNGRRFSLLQNGETGIFHHRSDGSEFFVSSQFGARYHLKAAFFDVRIGPGYILQNSIQSRFKYKEDKYVKLSSLNSRFMVSSGISLGLNLGLNSVAVAWNISGIYPFLENESNILPRQSAELTYRFTINHRKKA